MKLSVVLGGRDDNYGENFIERLNQAVTNNLKVLDSSNVDYEIIVVDFNPIGENYLYQNSLLSECLSHSKVKNLIVDNSVILAESLSSGTYYEYFAKNAGIRYCDGDFIFVTNSDILLSEELVEEIKNEMQKGDIDEYFYRVRYRGEIELGTTPNDDTELLDLHDASVKSDPYCAAICGQCSGDASVFSRKVMFETATGYNEGEVYHRTSANHSHMDSEIVWNCLQKGKSMKLLESPYYHVSHGRPHVRDGFCASYTYSNKDDWGFIKYPTKKVNENTTLMSA